MATITPYSTMNLAEINRRAGYDDLAAVLGELSQMNEFLADVPWFPASHGNYHEALQAVRLGAGAWSKANAPITSISSQAEPIVEPVKMYEGDSIVDDRLLKLAKDPRAVRDSEDAMNLEGMIQGFMSAIFYNNSTTTPDGPRSLGERRASLGTYCVGASGTGSDTTSLWLIELGKRGFHMVYNPSGTPGISSQDRGAQMVTAPTGSGSMYAWIRHFEVIAGIVLRDERALQRIANIESAGSSNIFSATQFIGRKNQLPSAGANAVAFCNRTLRGQIESDAYNKSNAAYGFMDIVGFGPVPTVAGVPVRICEAITDTETAIS